MHTLYNSDDFAVVQIDFDLGPAAVAIDEHASPGGGFEIVDKRLRKEIFLGGALAMAFRQQVDALVKTQPSVEAIDDFLASYSAWMHQPVVAH